VRFHIYLHTYFQMYFHKYFQKVIKSTYFFQKGFLILKRLFNYLTFFKKYVNLFWQYSVNVDLQFLWCETVKANASNNFELKVF